MNHYSNNSLSIRPIPIHSFQPTTSQVRDVPLIHLPGLSDEPLVNLSCYDVPVDSYYARDEANNPPYNKPLNGAEKIVLIRKSVAEKLKIVNANLAEYGLGITVFDGYRRIETQQDIWDFFWDSLKQKNSDMSEDDLTKLVSKFASDPRHFKQSMPDSWPLHSTGGSVDVMLRDAMSGRLLEMGAQFDELTELSSTSYYERKFYKKKIPADDIRLLNRRVLYWAMIDSGFTNYSYEYWHFDWGNQMHVATLLASAGKPTNLGAWYSYIS